ncbi:MAG TPA: hypothetical protein VKX16_01990 [Chloroflexota bacterium]|nr:hypothetical protein [Chloroflexota bacterium]
MLCDSAQTTQDGKIYILGGGWSQIAQIVPVSDADEAPPTVFAIAASFLIDWNDANRPFAIRVAIEPQDELPPIYEAHAQVTAGRSPQAIPGDPLRVLIALPVVIRFPSGGGFCVRAHMDGAPQDVLVRFQVVEVPALAAPNAGGR